MLAKSSGRFFVIDRYFKSDAGMDASTAANCKVGDAPRCPTCGRYTGSLTWLPPFRVELKLLGREFGDFADIAGDDLLVSERFYSVYRGSDLSGLSGFEPVEVTRVRPRLRKQTQFPRYFRGVVARSRTAFDGDSSEFHWANPQVCPDCMLDGIIMRWKRLIIKKGTWTGEDIFYARGMSSQVVVTERFKDLCESHSLKNIAFIPAEKYGRDFYPGRDTLPE